MTCNIVAILVPRVEGCKVDKRVGRQKRSEVELTNWERMHVVQDAVKAAKARETLSKCVLYSGSRHVLHILQCSVGGTTDGKFPKV